MKLIWPSRFTRAAKELVRRKPELLTDLNAALRQLETEVHLLNLSEHDEVY